MVQCEQSARCVILLLGVSYVVKLPSVLKTVLAPSPDATASE